MAPPTSTHRSAPKAGLIHLGGLLGSLSLLTLHLLCRVPLSHSALGGLLAFWSLAGCGWFLHNIIRVQPKSHLFNPVFLFILFCGGPLIWTLTFFAFLLPSAEDSGKDT